MVTTAMPPQTSATGSGPSASAKPSATTDPILRNALRYTVSAREYASLHKYILSRARVIRRNVPSVEKVNRIMNGAQVEGTGKSKAKGKDKELEGQKGATAAAIVGADDFNARAVRHALRVFVGTAAGMKLYTAILDRLARKEQPKNQPKTPLLSSPTFRLSLSLSTILLLYRLLFRFLTRLRAHLLDPTALPFRTRNPKAANALTSPYAPAVGASLAGLALGIYPAAQLRTSVAVFALFRALEFGWNAAEDAGALWGRDKAGRPKERPWWWGSWMLMPLSFGQLLHAAVFDRECFPKPVGDFIFGHANTYIHRRPSDAPTGVAWPGHYDVVDALAGMAKSGWPAFSSPALVPQKEILPSPITPLTSTAHPLISSLACATLHPSDPSCARTYLTFWLRTFPSLARFFLLFYTVLTLPKGRGALLYNSPLLALRTILARALRVSTFFTGALSTAWGSICLFQALLPRRMLATQRFFLGGFAAGFWAWLERKGGRGVFIYSARMSVDSAWKVGVKRRWWRAVKGGDVWVFVLAIMLSGVVYERDARAVREAGWRKGISWVRGEGMRDWAIEEEEEEDVAREKEE